MSALEIAITIIMVVMSAGLAVLFRRVSKQPVIESVGTLQTDVAALHGAITSLLEYVKEANELQVQIAAIQSGCKFEKEALAETQRKMERIEKNYLARFDDMKEVFQSGHGSLLKEFQDLRIKLAEEYVKKAELKDLVST